MKKTILTTFLVLFSVSFLLAQNLVLNGGLEHWLNPTDPEDWTKAENIFEEQTPIYVHGGIRSAKHTSDASTKDLSQDVTGIVAGLNYNITYWFYDNDPEARTRIWAYWLQGTSTLPDNEDELRPSQYSTDNPSWINYNVSLTAPAGADGFRFEVRVYKENNISGGSVYYDDFSITQVGVQPEPTNYPTLFNATASGLTIDLGWADAIGAQLPSSYLILASDQGTIAPPVDGTPIANDTDLSDGSGALNVPYGDQSCMFSALAGNTTYHFVIYSYTNGGTDINYKTDGTVPAANATTSNVSVILSENFVNGWGPWTTVSVIGAEEWDKDNTHGIGNTPCARVSGYNAGTFENEDWLISPPMDFNLYTHETLTFFNAYNYSGPAMEVKISTDYSGSGDPNMATWSDLAFVASGGSWEWASSGDVDISSFNGSQVYVAFKYMSTTQEAATWEVDDILITGQAGVGIDEINNINEVKLYPNPVKEMLTIEMNDVTGMQFEVYNSTGQKLYSAFEINEINMGQFQQGLYFIVVKNNNELIYTGKVLKQ